MEHNPRVIELDELPRAARAMEDVDEAQAREAERLARGRRRALRLDALDPEALGLLRRESEGLGITLLPGRTGGQGAGPALLVTDDETFRRLSVSLDERGEQTLAAAIRNTLAAYHRTEFVLSFADGERMEFGRRTRIMGVLNITPDSFSDGGRFPGADAVLETAQQMVEQGADILDVGGESTRPNAPPVPEEEETRRVVPVIESLKRDLGVRISVDTMKARVARRAIEAGADMVNDVSAFSDPGMLPVLRDTHAPTVIMHMRGTPRTMQQDTRYIDLMSSVVGFLRKSIERAAAAGIRDDKIVVDPGLGFGKSGPGNLDILRQLPSLRSVGRPILVGASRKSFIGAVLDLPVKERMEGSLAVAALAVWKGAHIIRAHDVAATVRAVRMIDAIRHR